MENFILNPLKVRLKNLPFIALVIVLLYIPLSSFEIQIRSVDKSKLTRIILESDIEQYYSIKKQENSFFITLNKKIKKFEIGQPSQQSIYIKNIDYKTSDFSTSIKINLKTPFTIIKSFTLKNPHRIIIDLKREELNFIKEKSKKDEYYSYLKSIIENYSVLIKKEEFNNKTREPVENLLNYTSNLLSETKTLEELTETELENLKNQIGLKLIGDYAYNTSLGISDVDEGPYKWRVRAGFDWDLLRDGLFKRKKQKQLLKQEIELNKLLRDKRIRKENYYFIHNIIIFLFSKEKIKNLEIRKNLINEILIFQKQRYYKNEILSEEIMKLERDLNRVNNLLDNYEKYHKQMITHSNLNMVDINIEELPIVDINIDAFLKELNNPPELEKLYQYKHKEINVKHSFLNDVRLKTWLYYYYYDRVYAVNDFFSLGVQVNIPFPFGFENRRILKKTEEKEFKAKYQRIIHENILESMNFYDEYKYKLDDLINFLNKRKLLLSRLNNIKIQLELGFEGSEIDNTFYILKQIFEVEYEITHIKQQMYLKIAQTFRNYGKKNIENFINLIDPDKLKNYLKNIYMGERYTYIWSDTFEKYNNLLLVYFLKSRNISHALLSFNKNIDKQKLTNFLDLAQNNNINVHAIISNNQWIFPDKRKNIAKELEVIKTFGFAGIHLDIEPHTFDDWTEKWSIYLDLYKKMLSTIKQNINNMELSLSIPVSDKSQYFEYSSLYADKIFIMAYGIKDPEIMKKTVNKFFNYPSNRSTIIIALRTSDFNSELELESFINDIYSKEKFFAFGLHKLSDIISKGEK